MLWRFNQHTLVHTPSFLHTRQARKFTERQPFISHRVQTSVRFVPKDPFVAKCPTVLAFHPNTQLLDPLRLGDLQCKVSETFRKTFVLLNQESGGSGGIISVVSSLDS